MEQLIPLSKPIIEEDEKRAVLQVLDSGIIAQGPVVRQLEESFAAYCDTEYAVALNSGTAAIHTALHCAELEPGDSVITSPFTFVASVNPILMQGARPKFVDIEEASFNIDGGLLEEAYDPTVKAVLPVDLFGHPADYDEIDSFADSHNLVVIEDAAQAVGAEYKGRRAGTLGQAACFSLYATKNIMSAEGGLLTTNSEKIAKEAKSFRQHGMDMDGRYEYIQLGYNYRTTDILAAIALTQLTKVDRFNAARLANATKMMTELEGIEGLVVPSVKNYCTSVFHQFTVRITKDFPVSRKEFIMRMKERGVQTGIYYPQPLHQYPHLAHLGYKQGDFPAAELAAKEVVSLPVNPSLEENQVEYIIESVKTIANA